MRKIIALYIILIFLIGLVLMNQKGIINFNPFNSSPYIVINDKKFDLLLAKSDDEKTKGLSGREKLDQDSGMLFIFKNKGDYSFWMKDMKFPIDIIYISDNTIVDIFENVQPAKQFSSTAEIPIYTPKTKINYVLEINANLAKKYNVKTGSKVNIKNITL